jgi:hypothetical protein
VFHIVIKCEFITFARNTHFFRSRAGAFLMRFVDDETPLRRLLRQAQSWSSSAGARGKASGHSRNAVTNFEAACPTKQPVGLGLFQAAALPTGRELTWLGRRRWSAIPFLDEMVSSALQTFKRGFSRQLLGDHQNASLRVALS